MWLSATSAHKTTLHAEVSTISPVHAIQPLKSLQQVLQRMQLSGAVPRRS